MVYCPYKEYMSINDKKICSRTKAYFLIGSDQLPNRLQNKYLKEIFGELNEWINKSIPILILTQNDFKSQLSNKM